MPDCGDRKYEKFEIKVKVVNLQKVLPLKVSTWPADISIGLMGEYPPFMVRGTITVIPFEPEDDK
jgi:hypothetical protein